MKSLWRTTWAFGWFSASLTGRRERMEIRPMEGFERAYERIPAPAVPVAPVRIMWAIGAGFGVDWEDAVSAALGFEKGATRQERL